MRNITSSLSAPSDLTAAQCRNSWTTRGCSITRHPSAAASSEGRSQLIPSASAPLSLRNTSPLPSAGQVCTSIALHTGSWDWQHSSVQNIPLKMMPRILWEQTQQIPTSRARNTYFMERTRQIRYPDAGSVFGPTQTEFLSFNRRWSHSPVDY